MKRRDSTYSTAEIPLIHEKSQEIKGLKSQIDSIEAEMTEYLTSDTHAKANNAEEVRLREELSKSAFRCSVKERKLQELQKVYSLERKGTHFRCQSEGQDFNQVRRLRQSISAIEDSIASEADQQDVLLTDKERMTVQVQILKERLGYMQFALSKVNPRHFVAVEVKNTAEIAENEGNSRLNSVKNEIEEEKSHRKAKIQEKQRYKEHLSRIISTNLRKLSQSLLFSQHKSLRSSDNLTLLSQSIPELTETIKKGQKSIAVWQGNVAYLQR